MKNWLSKNKDVVFLIVATLGVLITLIIMLNCQKPVYEANDLIPDLQDNKTTIHNTQYLQSLMDKASEEKATIKLPEGHYYFAKQADVINNTERFCIKCKSNVCLEGQGIKTVLYPVAEYGPDVVGGLDMFYFNDYRESNFTEATFLENAIYKNFAVDGSKTKISNYNTSGKGFMINLFKNCILTGLIVRNIDATGIGVDCPIGCKIENCIVDNCGKAASNTDQGASGIGIGYGYSAEESLEISGCQALGNKKFGIFFEWQGRWSKAHESQYPHKDHKNFDVYECYCAYNKTADIGGLYSSGVIYSNNIFNTQFFDKNSSDNKIIDTKKD